MPLAFLSVHAPGCGPCSSLAVQAQQCHCWDLTEPLLGAALAGKVDGAVTAPSLQPCVGLGSSVKGEQSQRCHHWEHPVDTPGLPNCPANVPCPLTEPGMAQRFWLLLGLCCQCLPTAGGSCGTAGWGVRMDPGWSCISSVCVCESSPRGNGVCWEDKALENASEVFLLGRGVDF